MSFLTVRAAPGLKVPLEDYPRRYIDESSGIVPVADSAYYRRRVTDGDLIEIKETDLGVETGSVLKTKGSN